MISAGIDAGSRAIKVVLFDGDNGGVLASAAAPQGLKQDALACGLFEKVLKDSKLDRGSIGGIVATGYGRNNVSIADTVVTEITCHARGVFHLMPQARTVIEIGGQDSKLLKLNSNGTVRDFAMNDRCAAGTGKFLELVADRLEVQPDELGRFACGSKSPAAISSTCVVFAETEIIGLLAGGCRPEDIAAGVERSIANRIRAMMGRNFEEPVVFTGGVALIPGVDAALAEAIGTDVIVAPMPQMTGALGAALMANGFTR